MMDYQILANFLMNLLAYPVKEMCKIIDSFPAGADVIDRAFAAASVYYNYKGNQKCFHVGGGDDPHGFEGWSWQACTEMVMPMTVSNERMFPPYNFSYEKSSDSCLVGYGVRSRMDWITSEYGGHKIDKVLKRFGSNIIFSNGMRDPWSGGRVLKNISYIIIALVTEKGGHHLDLRSTTKDDPDWLVEQRRLEVEIIHGWIDQYNKDISQM
ncbi:Lysosomal Pro-X carboxypeptidase [Hordeum vulgare]|nr:Lysosomal Pro-X carboxypeptidase [Hordeum vulgare]